MQSLTEKIILAAAQLDAVSFYGLCRVTGAEGEEFDDMWASLIDKVDALNRKQKRNLWKIVKNEIKEKKKDGAKTEI